MPRHFFIAGGALDQLLLLKREKVTVNTVTISLAAWPTFDQFSCIFENICAPHPPHKHITELFYRFCGLDRATWGEWGSRKHRVFLACLNGSGTILLFSCELSPWICLNKWKSQQTKEMPLLCWKPKNFFGLLTPSSFIAMELIGFLKPKWKLKQEANP